MSNLRKLRLFHIIIPNDLISAIPEMNALEELDIRWCKMQSFCVVEPFTQPPSPAETPTHQLSSIHGGLQESTISQDPASQQQFAGTESRWPPNLTHLTLIGLKSTPTTFISYVTLSDNTPLIIHRHDSITKLLSAIVSPHLKYLHTTSHDLGSFREAYEASLLHIAHPSLSSDQPVTVQSRLERVRIAFCNKDQGVRDLIRFLEERAQHVTQLEILDTTNEECQELSRAISQKSTPPDAILPSLKSYVGPSVLSKSLCIGRELTEISFRDWVSCGVIDTKWAQDYADPSMDFVQVQGVPLDAAAATFTNTFQTVEDIIWTDEEPGEFSDSLSLTDSSSHAKSRF
jgi:hypothetical protein